MNEIKPSTLSGEISLSRDTGSSLPEAELHRGEVRLIGDDGNIEIAFKIGKPMTARRAASCLIAPLVGDTVLVAKSGTDGHVIAVLDRSSSQEAILSVPTAQSLTIAQERIALRTSEITADTETLTVRFGTARFLGKIISGITDSLELAAKTMKRVAGHDMSQANTSVRIVESVDTLQAGNIAHQATDILSLKSSATVIDASTDVRVNGERISLG
jgi:hypothetical protein